MCGVIAVVSRSISKGCVAAALTSQRHRGPDGQGLLIESAGAWQLAIAHQRLAVIDLTAAAAQPMASRSGDCVVAFNGEIYNYREIRETLKERGVEFRTDSDTEVLLEAIVQFGVHEALRLFNGMWAFIIFNRRTRTLHVSRDRFGVKPLYYFQGPEGIYFASEIKALLELVGKRFKVNATVVEHFIAQSQVDYDNSTFFEGIYKVPPGHYASIDLHRDVLSLKHRRYWNLNAFDATPITLDEAVEQTRWLLRDAVRIRLRSDVPVGALVSGGIDSSAIAAAMCAILPRDANLNLFGAISDDIRFDESPFMDAVGGHLGKKVEKVRLAFEPQEAMNLLDEAIWHNDEPFGNFTPVAKYLLMERAREMGITVILSGQGADETYCGYLKYLGFYLQSMVRGGHYFEAMRALWAFWRRGTVLRQFNYADAKRYLPSRLRRKGADIRGEALKALHVRPLELGLGATSEIRERQVLDVERYSVPVLLHWEDRMSMTWSREIRNPFLDYRLVQHAVSLPPRLKLSRGWTKYTLRLAIEDELPPEITWRRDKQGFSNPISEWLKHDLAGKVEECFAPDGLVFRSGLLDRQSALSIFSLYRQQPHDRGGVRFTEVFNPLVLELWMRRFATYLQID